MSPTYNVRIIPHPPCPRSSLTKRLTYRPPPAHKPHLIRIPIPQARSTEIPLVAWYLHLRGPPRLRILINDITDSPSTYITILPGAEKLRSRDGRGGFDVVFGRRRARVHTGVGDFPECCPATIESVFGRVDATVRSTYERVEATAVTGKRWGRIGQ